MTRSDVIDHAAAQRKETHSFIKTWSTGYTFVDFDLIDRFILKPGQDGAIEGFELLDLEQMWLILLDLDPDKLLRVKKGETEVIEWEWKDSSGTEKKTFFPFSPEGIMTIMDNEFFA